MFEVVEISLCPSHSWISFRLTPLAYNKLAQLCRKKSKRLDFFRHAYACHCLKKWVADGKDLSVYLPILKTYMGHDSFEDTAYYLRLTADVFPDITIKLKGYYPDIIPSLGGAADAIH